MKTFYMWQGCINMVTLIIKIYRAPFIYKNILQIAVKVLEVGYVKITSDYFDLSWIGIHNEKMVVPEKWLNVIFPSFLSFFPSNCPSFCFFLSCFVLFCLFVCLFVFSLVFSSINLYFSAVIKKQKNLKNWMIPKYSPGKHCSK